MKPGRSSAWSSETARNGGPAASPNPTKVLGVRLNGVSARGAPLRDVAPAMIDVMATGVLSWLAEVSWTRSALRWPVDGMDDAVIEGLRTK